MGRESRESDEEEQTGELRGKEMTQENIMTLASGYRKEEKE